MREYSHCCAMPSLMIGGPNVIPPNLKNSQFLQGRGACATKRLVFVILMVHSAN